MAFLTIPAHVIINGKLYSSAFDAIDEISSTLQFTIQSSHTEHFPSIKLHIAASRPTRKDENPLRVREYEVDLFFRKDAIINYSYAVPTNTSDIDRAFRARGGQNMRFLRCLNFGANEVIVETGLGQIPRLCTEEMASDLARLLATAKNVNNIPDAVLEISCLFTHASTSTDMIIRSMEHGIFDTPLSPSKSSPSKSASAPSSPVKYVRPRQPHLTMDSLFTKFNRHPSAGSEFIGSFNTPLTSPFLIQDGKFASPMARKEPAPQQKKLDKWLSKTMNAAPSSPKGESYSPPKVSHSPPKANYSPPKANYSTQKAVVEDISRDVCFNCFQVGHWKHLCVNPKRVPKKKKKEKKKVITPPVDGAWSCRDCGSVDHPYWFCNMPEDY